MFCLGSVIWKWKEYMHCKTLDRMRVEYPIKYIGGHK